MSHYCYLCRQECHCDDILDPYCLHEVCRDDPNYPIDEELETIALKDQRYDTMIGLEEIKKEDEGLIKPVDAKFTEDFTLAQMQKALENIPVNSRYSLVMKLAGIVLNETAKILEKQLRSKLNG